MISAVHQSEAHLTNLGARLNWLRAGVLGANDGIVSVAGILAGVAGATNDLSTILTAGVAGAVAGSFSTAGGEYVSVNTQRDTEEAALRREHWELEHLPELEEAKLAGLYRGQGSPPSSRTGSPASSPPAIPSTPTPASSLGSIPKG